jgi:hypothetical protein
MRLVVFHSPILLSFAIVISLACYTFLVWLIGGCLSFAKRTPDVKNDELGPRKT